MVEVTNVGENKGIDFRHGKYTVSTYVGAKKITIATAYWHGIIERQFLTCPSVGRFFVHHLVMAMSTSARPGPRRAWVRVKARSMVDNTQVEKKWNPPSNNSRCSPITNVGSVLLVMVMMREAGRAAGESEAEKEDGKLGTDIVFISSPATKRGGGGYKYCNFPRSPFLILT